MPAIVSADGRTCGFAGFGALATRPWLDGNTARLESRPFASFFFVGPAHVQERHRLPHRSMGTAADGGAGGAAGRGALRRMRRGAAGVLGLGRTARREARA